MECNRHDKMIVLDAFSEGKCKKCDSEIITEHIPCNVICEKCSVKFNLCEICGEKMNDLEVLNDFLISVANTDVGIRRKIVRLQSFLNILKEKKKL